MIRRAILAIADHITTPPKTAVRKTTWRQGHHTDTNDDGEIICPANWTTNAGQLES